LFPYAVLIILLINGLTLKGAGDGIRFYLKPEWHMLRKPDVGINKQVKVLILCSKHNKFSIVIIIKIIWQTTICFHMDNP